MDDGEDLLQASLLQVLADLKECSDATQPEEQEAFASAYAWLNKQGDILREDPQGNTVNTSLETMLKISKMDLTVDQLREKVETFIKQSGRLWPVSFELSAEIVEGEPCEVTQMEPKAKKEKKTRRNPQKELADVIGKLTTDGKLKWKKDAENCTNNKVRYVTTYDTEPVSLVMTLTREVVRKGIKANYEMEITSIDATGGQLTKVLKRGMSPIFNQIHTSAAGGKTDIELDYILDVLQGRQT